MSTILEPEMLQDVSLTDTRQMPALSLLDSIEKNIVSIETMKNRERTVFRKINSVLPTYRKEMHHLGTIFEFDLTNSVRTWT